MNIFCIKKPYKQKQAFSLVELSVVLLVIATLLSTSVIGYKSIISASKVKSNRDSIDAVYKAIGNYLITNKKLPCPASLTLTKGDVNYGNEVRVSGICSSSSGVIINGNLAYGMVPTQTLGLPANIAEDSFGTKLSYIIDKRFATLINSAGTNGFEGTDPDATMIQIQELSSSIVLSNAIMVIISHGANKLGGFNSNSTSQNPNPANADELSNISTNFDNIFMRSSNSSSFDDVLLFKNKMQLAVESGFDKMACRSLPVDSVTGKCEASSILTNLSWKKAEYNQELSSSGPVGQQGCPSACITLSPTLYPSRKCGKYGVWGPILYPCKYNSSIVCSVTGITGIANQSLPYANSSTAINCISGYSGSPTYTCLSSGPASIIGSCTPITCSASGTGYSVSGLAYGNSSFSCNTSGYTGTINYNCSGTSNPGTFNYSSGSCKPSNCTLNVPGINSVTVGYTPSWTSISCNASGYYGNISYICNGSLTTSGSCGSCGTSATYISALGMCVNNSFIYVNTTMVARQSNDRFYGYNGYYLIIQGDRNFVLYNSSGSAIWATGTYNGTNNYHFASLQADGNLVVYDENGSAVWAAPGTWGNIDDKLIVGYNGKAYVVTSDGSRILWSVP